MYCATGEKCSHQVESIKLALLAAISIDAVLSYSEFPIVLTVPIAVMAFAYQMLKRSASTDRNLPETRLPRSFHPSLNTGIREIPVVALPLYPRPQVQREMLVANNRSF